MEVEIMVKNSDSKTAEKLYDSILKAAFEDAEDQELASYPRKEELDMMYQRVPEFDKRIMNTISKAERPYKRKLIIESVLKIAASVCIFFAISILALFNVEASRNFILNTLIQIQSDYVAFEFFENGSNQAQGSRNIPDGYANSNRTQDGGGFMQSVQPEGGLVRRNSITFYTLFRSLDYTNYNDTALTLYLENYFGTAVAPHANQLFNVRQDDVTSLASLYEAVKTAQSNTRISVELIRESYIVIRTDLHDLQYVMITNSLLSSGTSSDSIFGYMPMQGRFFDQDVFQDVYALNFWQIEGVNYAIYIPYHLFDDHLLFYLYDSQGLDRNHDLSHRIGHYYKIYGNMDDFRAFYEDLNLYEVMEVDNQLILKGQIYKRELGHSSAEVSPINGRIILSFKEEGGQRYVAYSFDVE